MEFEGLKEVLTTLPAVISTLKQVKDMLPDGTKKDEATRGLEQAEEQLKIAQAQAAKSLGYNQQVQNSHTNAHYKQMR